MSNYEDVFVNPRGELRWNGGSCRWEVWSGTRMVVDAKGPGVAICKARENGIAITRHPGEGRL